MNKTSSENIFHRFQSFTATFRGCLRKYFRWIFMIRTKWLVPIRSKLCKNILECQSNIRNWPSRKKLTFGAGTGSNVTVDIIEVGAKIDSKLWTMKTQKTNSMTFFVVELGLISYLALVYLLLNFLMLLFNNISLITRLLRLLHIPLEIWRKLNVNKPCERSVYVQYPGGIDIWKYNITFFGKFKIIIHQYHGKKNINELKATWRKYVCWRKYKWHPFDKLKVCGNAVNRMSDHVSRTCHPKGFHKKDFLRNFTIFTRNHLCCSRFW